MITKNFILMCEQAEEIQKTSNQIVDGDYYYWSVDKKIHLSFTENFMHEHGYVVHHPEQWDYLNERKCIWLPTQEQLQKMMTEQGYFRFTLIELFYHFASDVFKSNSSQKFSMNELWLAFVMQEKYNKAWTGDKWVKAE